MWSTMRYQNHPLVQALVKFKEAAPISFHVPGHKNGILSGLPADLRSALKYDFTELEGLDDLHEPDGVLRKRNRSWPHCISLTGVFFL